MTQKILLLTLIIASCGNNTESVQHLLTNGSCKLWQLKSFKNQNEDVVYKSFQTIQFCENGDFKEFKNENNQLVPVDFSDNIPSNTWKMISDDTVALNEKKYVLKKITSETLVLIDVGNKREINYCQKSR